MEITNNTAQHQFETWVDGNKAELMYRLRGNTLFLLHTWVPPAVNGRGIASQLALHALEYARDSGFKIAVFCPFVAAYIKRHPEWYELYDKTLQPDVPLEY